MVLMAPVVPGAEALGVLLDLLDSDPMFGATAARVQCWDGCCLQSVARLGGGAPVWIPMAVLADLPAHELLGDVLSPYMALAPVVLTDFGDVTPPLDSLSGMVIQRLIAARRCGFRTALANRAVVRVMGAACDRPAENPVGLSRTATIRLRDMEPEFGGNPLEWRGGSLELFEKLTGQLLRLASGGRPSLLLDMRNVRATFNGTTAAALGAAYGLHRTKPAWDIAMLAHPAGAGFHDFAAMFPGWPVYTSAAAVRLHRGASLVAAVAHRGNGRPSPGGPAQRLPDARHYRVGRAVRGAGSPRRDVAVFLGRRRRPAVHLGILAAAVPRAVSEGAWDGRRPSAISRSIQRDYTRPELLDAAQDDYILVVGNHLDHKDVSATVGARVSVPLRAHPGAGAVARALAADHEHTSGTLAELDMHRLYASAKLVVFPVVLRGIRFSNRHGARLWTDAVRA